MHWVEAIAPWTPAGGTALAIYTLCSCKVTLTGFFHVFLYFLLWHWNWSTIWHQNRVSTINSSSLL